MKKLLYTAAALLAVCCTTSCSKEWLETDSTTSGSPQLIFSTIDNAELAVNGLARLMCMQHSYYGQGASGEGWIKYLFGNFPGQNFSVPRLTGWSSIMNMSYHQRNTSSYDSYGWYYYYRIIDNANMIIGNIDDVPSGGDAEVERRKTFIKAQALVYRAYGHFQLTQLYSHRWMDTNHGDADGIVIRTESTTESAPISKLSAVYTQIFDDLKEAIAAFESVPDQKRIFLSAPDLNVAQAILARAAITRGDSRDDYQLAASMAAAARKGYPLMSVADYRSDFESPTPEWIWGSYASDDQNLQYWSFQAQLAYNANSSRSRGYRHCISRELLETFPDSDIRKNLFVHPAILGMTDAEFQKIVNQTSGQIKDTKAIAKIDDYFADRYAPAAGSYYVAYEHRKFGCFGQPGVAYLNHIRSSEMILLEAEAQCRLGNDPAAQELLVELNATSQRDPGYTCSKTGDELFEEIVRYRALELWGEGFDWFDMKRWGKTLNRKSFKNGGNFASAMAVTIRPDEANQWTWVIPEKETAYNTFLNEEAE